MLLDQELKETLLDQNSSYQESDKEKPSTMRAIEKNRIDYKEPVKSKIFSSFLLFLAGISFGVICTLSFHKTPITKEISELHKALDALEAWEATHLNPKPSPEEIIEIL